MSNHMRSSSEWEQIYQQDGQAIASSYATTSVTSETVLSPSSLCTTSDQLTARGSVSKPIKKRSRASKTTATTLLNANTKNFRSLVQQFTGCPRTPFSLESQRGPVNLNFRLGSDHQQNQSNIATSTMGPNFGSNYYNPDTQQLQQHELMRHQQQQQVYQEQQRVVSFDNGTNMEIPDGFGLDDVSFHQLTRDSFSNENKNDSYFS